MKSVCNDFLNTVTEFMADGYNFLFGSAKEEICNSNFAPLAIQAQYGKEYPNMRFGRDGVEM